MDIVGTKKDVESVNDGINYPISLNKVKEVKEYLDTKNIHKSWEVMFEDAKHTKRFTDIPWNLLRLIVVLHHHFKGKITPSQILYEIKAYKYNVPMNKKGANIKNAKYKISEQPAYNSFNEKVGTWYQIFDNKGRLQTLYMRKWAGTDLKQSVTEVSDKKLAEKILDEMNKGKHNPDKVVERGEKYAKGSNIKGFFNKAKDLSKKGYDKSKAYADKKIHDKKRDLAIQVIEQARYNTTDKRDSSLLGEASDLVYDKYAKGSNVKPFEYKEGSSTIYINGTKGDVEKMYLDYVNNFLTIGAFADYYGISDEQAKMIIEEGRKYNEQYAKSGGIPNNYQGKTDAEIWDAWDESQRLHFMNDHNNQLSVGQRMKKEWVASAIKNDYKDLGMMPRAWVKTHVESGQYGKGGNTKHKKDWTCGVECWFTNEMF